MSLTYSENFTITLSSFFMKCVGIWSANTDFEQRLRNFALFCTVFTLIFSVWVQTRDLYYSWGDFGARTYVACNILCLNIILFKIFILWMHKKKFLYLIDYMQTNFWQSDYAPQEQTIFDSWTQICTYFICFFTFFTEASNICYMIQPIVANIGKNESDRILPFNMWVDLPLSLTPYFEITFVIQTFSLLHIGVCYICSDNILCIMNLHTASQFQILQYRLENMHGSKSDDEKNHKSLNRRSCGEKCYITFRNCVQQHQSLIQYCSKLEEVFTSIVLAQVLTFSLLICFVGYQVVLSRNKVFLILINYSKFVFKRLFLRFIPVHCHLITSAFLIRIPICNISFTNAFKIRLRHVCLTFSVYTLFVVRLLYTLFKLLKLLTMQADLSSTRRITFINLLTSSLCQLFMFTYSCDCLTQTSTSVATAVYAGIWVDLPMDEFGKMIRKDMQFAIMRTRQPCCLTANGFFSVSLETYTNILSTAMSYFTLLKQSSTGA
ncbi:uncharacterized protein LOC143346060 [Colletes latitarsis]|uniref:uncharacterized protein LOC143346060 n=1 Tax=Colletes latitarsis TaxID=2605962 RepID=UPI0040365C9E